MRRRAFDLGDAKQAGGGELDALGEEENGGGVILCAGCGRVDEENLRSNLSGVVIRADAARTLLAN
jgi:hypothetical protein